MSPTCFIKIKKAITIQNNMGWGTPSPKNKKQGWSPLPQGLAAEILNFGSEWGGGGLDPLISIIKDFWGVIYRTKHENLCF